jgi:hypothetical protein
VVAGEASVDGVGGGSLAVFRQNADGSFAAPTYELPAPEVPLLVRVDVDGDGVLDLAALELEVTGDSALLYRRSGGGALDTATEMLTGGRASTLAIADFDLDGALEAAIGLLDQSELLVRSVPTELDGGLPAVLQRFDLGPVPRGMRVLQTDALAFPDLAVSHALGTTFLVGSVDGLRGLRGFPVPIECHLLAVADFDGDGAGDVVTVDLFQRRLSLLVGTASAELIGAGEIEIGDGLTESPGGFDLADMDGDGDPDVVLAVYATGQVQVHPFRERIGNQLLFDAPVVISVGQQPIGIGAGDLDGDGFRDVVVTNSGDGTVEVLLGDGELGFVSQGAVAVEGTPLALVVRDLDGDGNLDVALTTGSPDGSGAGLRVLSGDGAGGLALEASLPLAHLATTLRAVDLDQDQDLELVANQTGLEAMGVVIAATDGGLADFATQVVEVLSPDDVDAEPATVLVARITADARPDLVVITASGRPLLFENSPGLEFGPAAFPAVGDNSPTAPFGTRYARLADLDGDELPELLLLAPDRPQVWVARAAPLAP